MIPKQDRIIRDAEILIIDIQSAGTIATIRPLLVRFIRLLIDTIKHIHGENEMG